jgi:hypothetical protein
MINWDAHFREDKDAAMFGAEVMPDKITHMTPEEAIKALSDGYKSVTGYRPNKLVLGLLAAQSALETANWQSGIHNYNFGNFKATSSDKYIQYFGCGEIIDGVSQNYPAGDPHCVFAAYPDAASGAAAYIRGLKNRSNWWNGLQTKTAAGFIKGLTTPPAYFTANPATYLNTLEQRLVTYQPLANKYAGSLITALFGLAIGGGLWYGYNRLEKVK